MGSGETALSFQLPVKPGRLRTISKCFHVRIIDAALELAKTGMEGGSSRSVDWCMWSVNSWDMAMISIKPLPTLFLRVTLLFCVPILCISLYFGGRGFRFERKASFNLPYDFFEFGGGLNEGGVDVPLAAEESSDVALGPAEPRVD